jgi:glycosyltransferase involved in cell wall biosynthesis
VQDVAMIRISLVVPAYNEERYLPTLLASVAAARRRYAHGAGAFEVIVADNASTDATAAIARAAGCRVVHVAARSIAAARNGGASAASGAIVAFVDADSRIHPDTFDAIERTLGPDVVVGVTGVRMSRRSPGIAASTFVIDNVSRLTGVGTGVVFCRRADWLAVGGYDETRLYGEDVRFLFALKRLGRARGQHLARARGVVTVSSARKFDRHGDWHVFTTTIKSAAWYVADRKALDRFVRRYWYEDR